MSVLRVVCVLCVALSSGVLSFPFDARDGGVARTARSRPRSSSASSPRDDRVHGGGSSRATAAAAASRSADGGEEDDACDETLEWRLLREGLLRELRRCRDDFTMIEDGDRIAVAVSGGKDSASLAVLLEVGRVGVWGCQRRSRVRCHRGDASERQLASASSVRALAARLTVVPLAHPRSLSRVRRSGGGGCSGRTSRSSSSLSTSTRSNRGTTRRRSARGSRAKGSASSCSTRTRTRSSRRRPRQVVVSARERSARRTVAVRRRSQIDRGRACACAQTAVYVGAFRPPSPPVSLRVATRTRTTTLAPHRRCPRTPPPPPPSSRTKARASARSARACGAARSTARARRSAATSSRWATTATTRSRRCCSTWSTRGQDQAGTRGRCPRGATRHRTTLTTRQRFGRISIASSPTLPAPTRGLDGERSCGRPRPHLLLLLLLLSRVDHGRRSIDSSGCYLDLHAHASLLPSPLRRRPRRVGYAIS